MGSPFLAEYAVTFDQPEWLDVVVTQFLVAGKHTYDEATGLYYHAWDESRNQRWAHPETGQSPNFWGRSMGWWFMALVDVLDYLPEDQEHLEHRGEIVEMIQGLAAAVSNYQHETGLWYQVVDQGNREGNYLEASVSAMFMYAIAKAVNKGYLNPSFRMVAERAYEGLMQELIVEDARGVLSLTVAVP